MLGMWSLRPAVSREHRYQTGFPINEQLLIKLGASPQLECWNTGLLGYCVLENWDVGSLEKSLLTCEGEYQEMEIFLSNQHSIIPSFHYSMSQAGAHAVKKQNYSQ